MMKEKRVRVDGKLYTVKIVESGNPFIVEVNRETWRVTLGEATVRNGVMNIDAEGQTFNVEFDKPYRPSSIKVNGKPYAIQYETSRENHRPAHRRSLRSGGKPFREGGVASLMPGKVVSLKVEAGQKVVKGDTLCVLEAMKMENEIVTPTTGVVAEVRVSEGDSVNKGDILFTIE